MDSAELLNLSPQWLSVVLVSTIAVYLGYRFILGQKEAPVVFNVPIPAEVRSSWTGRNWDEVQGEGKRVLEGQVRNASCIQP